MSTMSASSADRAPAVVEAGFQRLRDELLAIKAQNEREAAITEQRLAGKVDAAQLESVRGDLDRRLQAIRGEMGARRGAADGEPPAVTPPTAAVVHLPGICLRPLHSRRGDKTGPDSGRASKPPAAGPDLPSCRRLARWVQLAPPTIRACGALKSLSLRSIGRLASRGGGFRRVHAEAPCPCGHRAAGRL